MDRFICQSCRRGFSRATLQGCYRQNKRHLNFTLGRLLVSGVSQRRIALLLGLSRTTVVRKFLFITAKARQSFHEHNAHQPPAESIEFDDQETFEHSKCKPLSITLAVQKGSRRILGFEVSPMPAKGLLAKRARQKYGLRKDERSLGRARLFEHLRALVRSVALIESDQNPHYPKDVARFFPHAVHKTHKGQRGSVVGQGELKKIRFDPLFSLNHTCAMTRANINRLFRKTWCTTKKPERLLAHLYLYADFHNRVLIA